MNTAKILVLGLAIVAGLGLATLAVAAPTFGVQGQSLSQAATPSATPSGGTPTATPISPTRSADDDKDAEDADGANTQKVAQAIADYFKVPLADVTAAHDKGIGYGELVIAYDLAKQSGKSVQDILAMKQAGQGWGKIARSLNIQPGRWGVTLGQIMSGHAAPDSTTGQHPGAGNGKGKGNDQGNGNGKGKGK